MWVNVVVNRRKWKWSQSSYFYYLPTDYNELVQIPLIPGELEVVRHLVNKGKPFGEDGWTDDIIRIYKLNITTREKGRPKKGT